MPAPRTDIANRCLLAVIAMAASGCYSGDLLIEQVRKRATRTRLDEVSLGNFRVTLPPEASDNLTEIDVTVYGEAARYRIRRLKKELAKKQFLLGDLATRTLRTIDRRELADPNLELLRMRLLSTVNEVLDGDPIQSIGFHDVLFIRH